MHGVNLVNKFCFWTKQENLFLFSFILEIDFLGGKISTTYIWLVPHHLMQVSAITDVCYFLQNHGRREIACKTVEEKNKVYQQGKWASMSGKQVVWRGEGG